MRLAYFLLAFLILGVFTPGIGSVQAQAVESHDIYLYAHTDGGSLILNTLTNWSSTRTEDPRTTITFTLQPVLGESLRIGGAIFITVYLSASTSMPVTLHLEISELKSNGQQVTVPGATIESPVNLDTRPIPFTFGVGFISYEFARGSSIQLQVRVATTSQGIPLLLWDDIRTPTVIRVPTVNPLRASFSFRSDGPSYGNIIQANPATGDAVVEFSANVTDPFGGIHIRNASLLFTANNKTLRIQPRAIGQASYMALYTFTAILPNRFWKISLELHDSSGEKYSFDYQVWVSLFYKIGINVLDATNNPLQDARLDVISPQSANWTATTNSTGWATISLPSSQNIGSYNLTVTWHNVQTKPATSFRVSADSIFLIRMQIYDPTVRLLINGFPVPNAHVKLMQGLTTIAEQDTGLNGIVSFSRIPGGNYTLQVQYLFSQFATALDVASNGITEIALPFPHQNEFLLLIIGAVTATVAMYATRRRTKLYPQPFNYFKRLTTSGLPQACFAIIVGNSGSGKTVLLESLAGEHLTDGRGCLYITNAEYPSRVRESMRSLGIPISEAAKSGRLVFIDSYSAVGGALSPEEYAVTSQTDLTALGLEISKCLQRLGPGADLYVDSLTPLLNALRLDYLLTFLQSIAAKVKANDGKVCMTVGTAIEKVDIGKLEETSDCVIETQLQESRRGQRRRMRIKKLRGQPYVDKWVNFNIETQKGIVFLTRTKPDQAYDLAVKNENQSRPSTSP